MLRSFLIILLSLFSFQTISAQQPDQRIGELINTENWFGLDKEYPLLKDSIQAPVLKVVAEAMIARNFKFLQIIGPNCLSFLFFVYICICNPQGTQRHIAQWSLNHHTRKEEQYN